MAAPTFVAITAHNGAAGTYTQVMPAGLQVDDLIFILVETSAGETVAVPSGFTQHPLSPRGGTGTSLQVFYRWATGSDPSVTISDSGDHQSSYALAYRGVNKTTPFHVQKSGTGSGFPTHTFSGSDMTTTINNCRIVMFVGDARDQTGDRFSAQSASGVTDIVERGSQGISSGNGGGTTVWDALKATAGAIGVWTAQFFVSTTPDSAWIQVALAPSVLPPEFNAELGAHRSIGIDSLLGRLRLRATGDVASSEVVNQAGATSPLWSSVDEYPENPNDTDWITNKR